ncbi:MAG: hypothetical protein ABL871_02110 [Terricaulis sp.]
MDLCGGHEEMIDLFAARLRGFLTPYGYDVHANDLMAIALCPIGNGTQMILLSFGSYRDDKPPEVKFELEGFDTSRGIIPVIGRDELPPGDAFGALFAKVRDLVYDWPEVLPRAD